MKKSKWYRRYCFLCNISKKIQQINLMGCYRFVGEWGERIHTKHNILVKHYNKTKFWWQPSKREI